METHGDQSMAPQLDLAPLQILDLPSIYTTFDTSSPLDMAFGALINDDVNFLKVMAHTYGKIRHNLVIANGLACNLRPFSDQTSF